MHKNILTVVGITILFLGMSITPSVAIDNVKKTSIPIGSGNTLYVGGSGEGNYTSIQDAIDDASDGDTVFVYDESSPYFETITINKTITLLGENKNTTIIQGTGYNIVVSISAKEVEIKEFTIKKGKMYGIVVHSDYVTILNNIIDSKYRKGIFLSSSSYNNISNNYFYNNGLVVQYSYKNNIYNNIVNNKPLIYLENKSKININEDAGQVILVNCDNISIKNQNLTKTSIGVQLRDTDNCYIFNNNISDNNWGGMELTSSGNNSISNNNITNNHYGIAIHDISNNNKISNNTLTNHGHMGIILYESSNNDISRNTITTCNDGCIYISDSCNYNTISRNTVSRAFDGISVAHSIGNIISNNTIFKNSYGVSLWFSRKNLVSGNNIYNNFRGVDISEFSTKNIVTRNNIVNDNGYGVVVSFCRNNKIIYNNIYGSTQHNAYIYNFAIFFNLNRWYKNFWGYNPIGIPVPIFGEMRILITFGEIKWFAVDWRPAKEPYAIEV